MTWRAFLQGLIRNYMLNSVTQAVLTDIDTNGLSAADEAVIDSYLDATKP